MLGSTALEADVGRAVPSAAAASATRTCTNMQQLIPCQRTAIHGRRSNSCTATKPVAVQPCRRLAHRATLRTHLLPHVHQLTSASASHPVFCLPAVREEAILAGHD